MDDIGKTGLSPPPRGAYVRATRSGGERSGFTLIELMVTVAIAVILLVVAVPSFVGLADRNRLRNAAEKLRSDVLLARSESLRRNLPVVLTFKMASSGTTWCYGLSIGTECDCQASADSATACELDPDVPSVVSSAAYRGITMPALPYESSSKPGSLTFNPARPALDNGSAAFVSVSGKEARVVIANQGRVRLCSPPGTSSLLYFDPC